MEGYDAGNGWAFGGPDGDEADARDADQLYGILEREIVPLYYDRGMDGIPRGWLEIVRHTLRTITPAFSSRRMLKEYIRLMYAPAAAGAEVSPAPPAPAAPTD